MATTMPGKEVEIEINVDSKTFGEAVEELADRVGTIKRATEVAAEAIAEGMKEGVTSFKGLGELEELGKIMAETKPKVIGFGEALYAKGPTSLDPILEGETISVGTVVYNREMGWGRLPLRIVEIIRTAEPTIVVKGDYGCNICGRYDELHEAHVMEITLTKLTRFPSVSK